jgi:multicomponent Na+:H+ antiporter subunit E
VGNGVVSGTSLIDFAARLAVCGCAWQVLNWGDPASWLVGGPVVFTAALLSRSLSGTGFRGFVWAALPGFLLFFLRSSMSGGLDVARRVLDPRLPVSPGFVIYHTTLPQGPGRVLFVNVISLLPGTVSAGLEYERLTVHALDDESNVETALRDLEERVGRLFGATGGA